ncbi:hypothetical protein L226DRAFT_594255 [Lentinus tigrinus ALCF2SS1-7]|uniref:26S proteasome complex subunit SEM1 n=1 Tax=Lentinus tigrinus ALCF2SS1-6 TaxID=1328759 RepID=A0A5C2SR66_9APHY|nr:hypothetical protein L227DRAFT_560293 [Lentinus tigrinus ALCF2SS1-6]RPD79021.1 hypothetical protein L226DRAFT_594255 [Lentinus tigrinus ALCF2SS1-7]
MHKAWELANDSERYCAIRGPPGRDSEGGLYHFRIIIMMPTRKQGLSSNNIKCHGRAGGTAGAAKSGGNKLWEDNWDHDDIEDDFSVQLRSELAKKKGNGGGPESTQH